MNLIHVAEWTCWDVVVMLDRGVLSAEFLKHFTIDKRFHFVPTLIAV